MALLTAEQVIVLDELENYVPGLKHAIIKDPIKIGTLLRSLVVATITSPDAIDLPTAITLVNEIKTKINAAAKN